MTNPIGSPTYRSLATVLAAPSRTVVVLFPTRDRLLDAAWRLLTAVDGLKRNGGLDPENPIVVWMSRYEQVRPELYLSSAAYDLAARITIRMRDTEASAIEERPAHCALLIDTSPEADWRPG